MSACVAKVLLPSPPPPLPPAAYPVSFVDGENILARQQTVAGGAAGPGETHVTLTPGNAQNEHCQIGDDGERKKREIKSSEKNDEEGAQRAKTRRKPSVPCLLSLRDIRHCGSPKNSNTYLEHEYSQYAQ